ncbi:MAG: hypothetical protein KGK01_13695 [Bradyrhizobium sp.]|uniref:hypothetical protein n=1 Tax=Bradyrhizobium sp. TaxID=376 RepID=UPI001C29C067|nr:hypothetical protein [Bradyrhizobium sp.]MBU6464538.1 hypothetical protein [Pseudomonadota bacterium]MDE2067737.1 hypothetical protein [Bradyrhizobium sp.]MDE2243436.1 hypothetical protein [Bradyrhizobium sp.]MDE2468334.1 hypothetical protein [Bradyrhizobium sp.]
MAAEPAVVGALLLFAIGGARVYHRINLAATWFAAGWALALSRLVFATAGQRD